MKPTKLVTGAEALALGALVSLGSIGCLITGFSLSSLCAFGTVALLALLLTGAGVVCFSFRRGGFGLLALLALLGGYLWQEGSIVRQTEALCKKLSKQAQPAKPQPPQVDYLAECEKELTAGLGRKVRIVSGKRKGRIELEYYGQEDLQQLYDALQTIRKKEHH